jgi:amino acid transporter
VNSLFCVHCLQNSGSDATAHIAEEVRDAGRYVPISIFWSYVANGIMAIIFLITYLFSIDSVDNALADPTGYPFIYVFRTAMSDQGVTALTIIVLIIVIAANISWNASTARQTFAFARDNGLPFSRWISHVNASKQLPVNSIILTCTITCLLSLINIGSSTAFNAIISVQVVSIMLTYCISMCCVLYRRVAHPELIPKARWRCTSQQRRHRLRHVHLLLVLLAQYDPGHAGEFQLGCRAVPGYAFHFSGHVRF